MADSPLDPQPTQPRNDPPDGNTVRCGTCGAAMPRASADLAADGYRCLSCSTDEKIEAMAEEDEREVGRLEAIRYLRFFLPAAVLLAVLVASLKGDLRWFAVAALAGTIAWGLVAARGMWR